VVSPGQSPSTPQYWRFLSIYAYTLCRTTATFHMVTHMVTGLVLKCSATPSPRGRVPSAPQMFGVLFYLRVHPLSQNYTKYDAVTHVGEERVTWGQPPLSSQESRVPVLPNFGGSPVFMPTPFNAQRPNSACNQYGELGTLSLGLFIQFIEQNGFFTIVLNLHNFNRWQQNELLG